MPLGLSSGSVTEPVIAPFDVHHRFKSIAFYSNALKKQIQFNILPFKGFVKEKVSYSNVLN